VLKKERRDVPVRERARTGTDFYDRYVKGNRLRGRQKYFADLMIEVGFYKALKLSGYDHVYAYKLMRSSKFKRYHLSLINEAMEEIQLTLGMLLKKRLKIADDKENPAKMRDDILKDLISLAKGDGDDARGSILSLTGGESRKMLKPSKDIDYEDITEDNGNGSAKKEQISSIEETKDTG